MTTQPESPELVAAVMALMTAKLVLWDMSSDVEELIGFDVETSDGALDAHCACIDRVEDVTEQEALGLIAELRAAEEVDG